MASPSRIVAVVGDVHLDGKEPHASWRAFRRWHRTVRPDVTVINGDFLDLAPLSRFDADQEEPTQILPELQQGASEIDALLSDKAEVVFLPGNHEARLHKYLLSGKRGPVLRGVGGLDLQQLWRGAGLSHRVRWVEESTSQPGYWVGRRDAKTLIRHGDIQSGRYGAQHLSAKLLAKTPEINQVVGHHHRIDLRFRTSIRRTVFALANGCLTGPRWYASGGDSDWQRGFAVLQFWDRDRRVTPHPVHVVDGQFCWAGKVYGP